jgi:hypothetical protein
MNRLMPMVDNATIVAFYGKKSGELPRQIAAVQRLVSAALGPSFRPWPLKVVHATIIALRPTRSFDVPDRVEQLLGYIKDVFSAGLTVQIGGFADRDYRIHSQGRRLYERSFIMSGGNAVIMGWPIKVNGAGADPTTMLDDIRRECERLGFRHKYHDSPLAVDPDCYMSIGRFAIDEVSDDVVADCEQSIRGFLSNHPIYVPIRLDDVSFVVYEDRHLSAGANRVYPLGSPVQFPEDSGRIKILSAASISYP